jgi:hypothetical protein
MRADYDKIPDVASRTVLAEALGCHPITLIRAERAGKLESTRLNSRLVVYAKSAVLDYLRGTPAK